MEIVADLHLHSRHSVATGRQADLPHLDLWGRYKGVRVVGTGDCTHPGWLAELTAQLTEVAPGTYELQAAQALPVNLAGPGWQETAPVRFLITGEVSTIYQKAGRVRKVHLLLVLSGLEAAVRLSRRLQRLGNVAADGRPILGLDARHLLELTLEQDAQALVIPAHIWTPWFSVLGAKSGFDSVEECFEDHCRHIYALETGLSSDPAMNWQVSRLDRFLLLSNSDAHSPQKLGREANLFTVPPTFSDLARAIRTGEGFAGTLEFFPEEGKYHLDGHRKCGLRLLPEETQAHEGRCPACGQPLTLGVLHRVRALADREAGAPAPRARPYLSLVGLPEVLGEVLEAGPGSKKVQQAYFRLLEKLGPELDILRRKSREALSREGGELLAHALEKMRRGEILITPGYDGLFGVIQLLSPEERRQFQGQGAFWSAAAPRSPTPEAGAVPPPAPETEAPPPGGKPANAAVSGSRGPVGLNAAQLLAVTHQGGALLVRAGPGTGKTRALTHRLAYLLKERGVPPEGLLAITFTRQAAQAMRERVAALLAADDGLQGLTIKTFHALGQQVLAEAGLARGVADEPTRRSLLRQVAKGHGVPLGALDRFICGAKQSLRYPEALGPEAPPGLSAAFWDYEAALKAEDLYDYEDLVARPALLLLTDAARRSAWQARYRHILVDEYQDVNEAQYRLLRILAGGGAGIMAIGDPNQAIYGFRGARPEFFRRFREDWPGAVTVTFTDTYRLTPAILEASRRVLPPEDRQAAPHCSLRPGETPVVLWEAASPEVEARGIAALIERLVGGFSHRSLEDGRLRYQEAGGARSFKDIAVLYRLHAQGAILAQALSAAGIPCQEAREGVGPEWEDLDLLAERVTLMTLHAAKGLEFPYVFLAGCEAGLLPLALPGEEPADPEEERRLFYVGLTRAQDQVILTRARRRRVFGQSRATRLSPLAELAGPRHLADVLPSPGKRRLTQPSLFSGYRKGSA
jgi:DNA helicase-2/ATP-dependent DNA helicase PcrA